MRGRRRRVITLSRRPPPGVLIAENRTGEGAWLLKWQDPKSKKMQYAYDVETVVRQRGEIFADNLRFAAAHREIVAKYRQELRRGVGRARIVAAMIAMIDQACFRPGSEASVRDHGHYGLTTLCAQHVTVRKNRAVFEYVGKAGVEQRRIVADDAVAELLRSLTRKAKQRGPNARLFVHDGRPIRAADLNAALPDGITVKMFRPFHATRIAARALVEARRTFGRRIPEDERARVLRGVYEAVADHLGNTPSICKTNYVDPSIVAAICEGEDR